MAVDVPIDTELLKSEIKKTYAAVSQEPEADFIFPTGRAWAEDLRYPPELAAAQMVGDEGHVTGIDMTPEMLAKARSAAAEMGAGNVDFVEGEIEALPFADEAFDVVVSNGVVDLVPDKDAVFEEIYRVLAPGGRIQIADVTIQNPVSEEGRRNIDLWTG